MVEIRGFTWLAKERARNGVKKVHLRWCTFFMQQKAILEVFS